MAKLSVAALELAVNAISQGLDEHAPYPQLLTVRDGVIQRFEVAMDLSWKLLQRVLKEKFELDINSLRTKKDLFREAAGCGLLMNVEAWLAHYEARNETSHTYDADTARHVFTHIPLFLPDAYDLIRSLKNVT